MHKVRVIRQNSLDQEFEMKIPLIKNEGGYFLVYDDENKFHKLYVFLLDLLSIEITPQ